MEQCIAFSVCSAVLILFLFISLLFRKVTKGTANKFFLSLCFFIFLTSLAEIICRLFPFYFSPAPENFYILNVLTYLYFISRNLIPPFFFMFIVAYCGLWHKYRSHFRYRIFFVLNTSVAFLLIFGNIWFNQCFYIAENLQFKAGPYILALYLNAFCFFIQAFITVILSRKILSKLIFSVFLMLIFISVGGSTFQFLFPDFTIENFCTAFSILLFTLAVQKPEENIDIDTGSLNFHAFIGDAGKIFWSNTPMDILFVKIEMFDSLKTQFRTQTINLFQSSLIKRFYEICGSEETDVYTISPGFYAIVSLKENQSFFDGVSNAVLLMMNQKIKIDKAELLFSSKICRCRCPDDLKNLKSLLNFCIHYSAIVSQTDSVVNLSSEVMSKDFCIKVNLDDIIKAALENSRFEMYYQPVYNVRKKLFSSAEALIRLNDPQYGFVSPALFIPAAEYSGAIHQIGDFVLEDVCRFISECDFSALKLDYIEINLSVAQAIEENLFEKVCAVINHFDLSPSQVNLEITETAADFNPEVFDSNIIKISSSGVNFSLDDYGTGYSNMKRLATLPLSIIKLDKTLADEYKSEKMNVVIRETVQMLKKMEKLILVEGIEDKDAFDYFVSLGCDYIQGYYFSKPLKKEDYLDFVKKHNCNSNGGLNEN